MKIGNYEMMTIFRKRPLYIYIYIYIYWQHFFINKYLIEYNRHFLSTYFLVNPFELPYWSYDIRRELVDKSSIISYLPSTFCPTYIYIYIYIYILFCRSKEKKNVYFKMNQSTMWYLFFLIIYFALTYVSSFLLSPESL